MLNELEKNINKFRCRYGHLLDHEEDIDYRHLLIEYDEIVRAVIRKYIMLGITDF